MHEPLESGVLPYCNQLPYESAKMNTKPTRRQALTTGLSVAGACLATPLVRADERDQPPATEPIATTRKPNSIAVSTYSYWRYRDDSKLKIEECIDLAAEAGFDGVEILHVQMQDDSNSTLQRITTRVSAWLGPVWFFNAPVICFTRSSQATKECGTYDQVH